MVPVTTCTSEGRRIPWKFARQELYRLRTFTCYPASAKKSAILFARAGFVYTGSGRDGDDTVTCVFCHCVKRDWLADDDIGKTHGIQCAMVTGLQSGNMPMKPPDNNVPFEDLLADSRQVSTEAVRPQGLNPNANPFHHTAGQGEAQRSHHDSGKLDFNPLQNGPATIKSKQSDASVLINQPPKRPEYRDYDSRLKTFQDWPSDSPVKKEELAAAGWYYKGGTRRDCTSCFHCGGALHSWEPGEDAWVAHARWFPDCVFIHVKLGDAFIEKSGELYRDNKCTSVEHVAKVMGVDVSAFQIEGKGNPLETDAAVMAAVEVGFPEEDVLKEAEHLKRSGNVLTTPMLYRSLVDPQLHHNITTASTTENLDLLQLEERNFDLRLQTLCKVCMDKEVAVVFLPCGHLLCCSDCAFHVKDCPVCRNQVKEFVRAFIE
ncbi:baculoviral IAP repeat-containing protein 7 [Elysia marginata]|uniref:Baculoviral IAP repeat-containing protein 7 n=1 Tax=Elysia marginata TaxID=1093978 RepID=A0AAV4GAZ7_9GAST|nr:baculoviral IAP repeat-containing protein 7 [Elysia marginata]